MPTNILNRMKTSARNEKTRSLSENQRIDQMGARLSQSVLMLNVLLCLGKYLWVILACFVVINLSLVAADLAAGNFAWAIVNLGFAALGARFLFLVLARGKRRVAGNGSSAGKSEEHIHKR
jgi:uncharacterized integral membrane protein